MSQTGRTDRQDNGLIAQGEAFYKWSPKKYELHTTFISKVTINYFLCKIIIDYMLV